MARAVFQVFKQWSTCITFIGFCHNSYYSLLDLKILILEWEFPQNITLEEEQNCVIG